MKPLSTNHIKLFLVNSRHNLFHWLTVVFIRMVKFIIHTTFSVYLAALGFIFAGQTVQNYSPNWFEKISSSFFQVPYFQLIKNSIIGFLNHWYQDAPLWWTVVFGIPLIIMGISLFLSTLSALYLTLTSSLYNHTHCPFCKQPIKAKVD